MPTINIEESTLLGVVPVDNKDEIEMRDIELGWTGGRQQMSGSGFYEIRVHTSRGDLLVAVKGDRSKPAILTYHDLGLNYLSIQPFFNYLDMKALLENFCVYHINAPGQEEGAFNLPENYVYPSMDELAHQINYVLVHFRITSFIGFGVGAGANILARFALALPQKVNALVLINCTSGQSGWIEWAYQKINSRTLRSYGMTSKVLQYLMWHHFGKDLEERNRNLALMYRQYFTSIVNPINLALFMDSYVRRTDLGITREDVSIQAPVLNITGALSPHVEDTVTFNGRLHPYNSTWMKISDCGMVLEEQPGKIAQAFRLFLQGEGYAPVLSRKKVSTPRNSSTSQADVPSSTFVVAKLA